MDENGSSKGRVRIIHESQERGGERGEAATAMPPLPGGQRKPPADPNPRAPLAPEPHQRNPSQVRRVPEPRLVKVEQQLRRLRAKEGPAGSGRQPSEARAGRRWLVRRRATHGQSRPISANLGRSRQAAVRLPPHARVWHELGGPWGGGGGGGGRGVPQRPRRVGWHGGAGGASFARARHEPRDLVAGRLFTAGGVSSSRLAV